MKKMSEMVGIVMQNVKDAKGNKTPHELAATVDLIKAANLFSPKYGYTYWLGKVKRAGVSYADMIGILKEVTNMDAKYSKGGTLTNRLTKLANNKKQNEHDRAGTAVPKKRATL